MMSLTEMYIIQETSRNRIALTGRFRECVQDAGNTKITCLAPGFCSVTEIQIYKEDETMACLTLKTVSERGFLTSEEVENVGPPG